jgi:hypothetical protein
MSEEEVIENTESTEETTEESSGVVEEVAESTTNFVDQMLEQIQDEDVKSAGFWKNLEGKDATEVGKYIKELQSFAGKKGEIPKEDATEEEWNSFYQKLGRPESVEGYDFEMGDEFKKLVGEDAAPFFEKTIEGFKEKAFEIGATPDKAEEIVDWYLGMIAEDLEQSEAELKEAQEEMDKELRSEWGNEYDGMMNGIKAMLSTHGMSDENLAFAEEHGLFQDPSLAIALGNIAARFQDDPEIGHHQTRTMAGVRDQLAEVNMEVMEYVKTGNKVPPHIAQKRLDLMNKLGDDL